MSKPFTSETLAERHVPIDDVLHRFPEGMRPTLRFVREDMMRRGYARKFARRYYTTQAMIDAYLGEVLACPQETALSGEPSSRSGGTSKGSGSRGAGFRNGKQTDASPEGELNAALALVRKLNAKSSATT